MRRDWIGERQGKPEYEYDLLMVAVGEAIGERMAQMNLTGTALADRLGVSRARVSQILSGADNLTLKSLVTVATALGLRVDVRFFRPNRSTSAKWAADGWNRPVAFRQRTHATAPSVSLAEVA